VVLTVEFDDGVVVELAFVPVAFPKRSAYPGQRLVAEGDPF
jgi:hypothetical protein